MREIRKKRNAGENYAKNQKNETRNRKSGEKFEKQRGKNQKVESKTPKIEIKIVARRLHKINISRHLDANVGI